MRVATACLLAILTAAANPAAQGDAALAAALRAALQPALPFPEARSDGTPASGEADPVWLVRWPSEPDAPVQVLANPLNPGNRKRALEAEGEIQKAAMRAQQQSQADYEKAVSDFQKTGRTAAIREISLRDDGVAGERYDAESQVTIAVHTAASGDELTVAAANLPQVLPGVSGASALVRQKAHVFEEALEPGEPPQPRYAAEQAWVVLGDAAPPAAVRAGGSEVRLRLGARDGSSAAPLVVVTVTGNPALVDQVLQKANWAALKAVTGG